MFGWRRDLIPWQYQSQYSLQLDHGKILSKASTRTKAKWHVQVWMLACTWDPSGKPFRFKLISIWSPQLEIIMEIEYWDPEGSPLGEMQISKSHVPIQLSRENGRCWVQSKSLLNHLRQLHMKWQNIRHSWNLVVKFDIQCMKILIATISAFPQLILRWRDMMTKRSLVRN